MVNKPDLQGITIVGGGLAGSEAAWQAAEMGVEVSLYEMRPAVTTGAHTGGGLAELVCSNSLGSNLVDRASGLLKEELRKLGSLLVKIAEDTSLPAGTALAVDRVAFSDSVTHVIESHPRIKIIREEVQEIPPGIAIIASGPLTSPRLTQSIQELNHEEDLYFFDAIAPIVLAESIDMDLAFKGSRYDRGVEEGGDYINCPFNQEEYERFIQELAEAQRIPLKEFEAAIESGVRCGAGIFFEGCLPVEILAKRGSRSLAYGPMRPIGLRNPHKVEWPYAIAQLRRDNLAGSLYNMVGFQTNLTFPEQKRVFRMIPGLEKAEFARMGQMHRNTFIASPKLLARTLQFRKREGLFFAGQITGVEGYMGNVATGLLAGINAVRISKGDNAIILPKTTMLGALCNYITQAKLEDFQPMKANFGILPPLESQEYLGKRERYIEYSRRALADLDNFLITQGMNL